MNTVRKYKRTEASKPQFEKSSFNGRHECSCGKRFEDYWERIDCERRHGQSE